MINLRPAFEARDAFVEEDGFIAGARQDARSITSEWVRIQAVISGVQFHEIKTVLTDDGSLTEVFRSDWNLSGGPAVHQVFQRVLGPRSVSAWHVHRMTTDRLFIAGGTVKIVLYDARKASPTFGRINVFSYGVQRPGLVVVPPGVWHGLQNLLSEPSTVLNAVDHAYSYDDPDHWRLPHDTPQIPYTFDMRPK